MDEEACVSAQLRPGGAVRILLAANESRRDAPWRTKSSLSSRPSAIGRRQAPAGSLTRGMRFTALPFPHEWLRRVTNAPPEQWAVIEADRRQHGADDTEECPHADRQKANRRSPRRHLRYLLGRLDQREARGVITDPARRVITVSSDNPAYPANEAVKPGDLVALGQVIWIGRRI